MGLEPVASPWFDQVSPEELKFLIRVGDARLQEKEEETQRSAAKTADLEEAYSELKEAYERAELDLEATLKENDEL